MSETITTATRPADAHDIVEQIGNWTLNLVGAQQLVDLGDGLQFKIRVNHMKSVKIIVKLHVLDTYSVYLVRATSGAVLQSAEMVYADQLSMVIEKLAGV